MKPLAMSFQLIIGPDKRLAAEIELVLEDGTVINRTLPANERMTIHFEDLIKEGIPPVLDPKAA